MNTCLVQSSWTYTEVLIIEIAIPVDYHLRSESRTGKNPEDYNRGSDYRVGNSNGD
jgi:hypothetical protein